MQKTIECCNICEKQINYPTTIRLYTDWVYRYTRDGEKIRICMLCADVLRKATDLGVDLPRMPIRGETPDNVTQWNNNDWLAIANMIGVPIPGDPDPSS